MQEKIESNPVVQSVNNSVPVVEQPKQNNFLVILLSILLFLSVSIAGFFAFQTQKLVKELTLLRSESTPVANVEPTNEPVTTNSTIATADPTVNWKTYINPEFSFSFKYPNNYTNQGASSGPFTGESKLLQTFSDPTSVVQNSDAAFDGITLYGITKMGTSNFSEYVDNEIKAISESPMHTNKNLIKVPVTINNMSGFYVDFSNSIRMYYIPSPDGKTVVEISRTNANSEFLTTFNQIISTFKFTD